VHFVLLGAGLFALDAWAGSDDEPVLDDTRIAISAGRVENLAALFAKTWKRPPSPDELRALVDGFVLEEALFRQGLAMGLDQEDAVIRRRVGQKMEFVVDDLLQLDDPSEEELERWRAEQPERYAAPTRTSFRQVFLNPEARGERLRADAARLLDELRARDVSAGFDDLGDRTLLHAVYSDVDSAAVARTFGEAFAQDLAQVAPGAWGGPLDSAYGVHLVFVEARVPGSPLPLDAVRREVERDWRYARREQAVEAFHAELVGRYEVDVDWPHALQPDAPVD
jgi:hypothetical protein